MDRSKQNDSNNRKGTGTQKIKINDKYYFGEICKREHEYECTGKSLRYKSARRCIKCSAESHIGRQKKINAKKIQTQNNHKFNELYHKINTGVFFLGKLCNYNHEYKNTDSSLRYIACRHCVICKRSWDSDFLNKDRERLLLYKKTYYNKRKKFFAKLNKERRFGPKRKSILRQKRIHKHFGKTRDLQDKLIINEINNFVDTLVLITDLNELIIKKEKSYGR